MSDDKKKKKRNKVERYIDKKVNEWFDKSMIEHRKEKHRAFKVTGPLGQPKHKSNVAQSEGKLGKTVDWDFGEWEKGDKVPTIKYPTKSQNKKKDKIKKNKAGGGMIRKYAHGGEATVNGKTKTGGVKKIQLSGKHWNKNIG
tara:strand:- start:24 stop:449 length:426 start_codon:yes stop_codon:yes gene_type:complete